MQFVKLSLIVDVDKLYIITGMFVMARFVLFPTVKGPSKEARKRRSQRKECDGEAEPNIARPTERSHFLDVISLVLFLHEVWTNDDRAVWCDNTRALSQKMCTLIVYKCVDGLYIYLHHTWRDRANTSEKESMWLRIITSLFHGVLNS